LPLALVMAMSGGAVAATTTTGSHYASKKPTPTLRCVWVDQRSGDTKYDLRAAAAPRLRTLPL